MLLKKLFASAHIVFFIFSTALFSQVKHVEGTELGENDDAFLSNMLGGDKNFFYAYRVRTIGIGTSYFIQKIDKSTLNEVFEVDMKIPLDNDGKVVDAEYSSDNVYVFFKQYYKDKHMMTLYYKKVSSIGVVSGEIKKILDIKTDYNEFVEFDVIANPSKTKFLVKASHKSSNEDYYKTNFILIDASIMEVVWTKTVNRKLFKGNFMQEGLFIYGMEIQWGFLGYQIDDSDNIFYGVQDKIAFADQEDKYRLKIGVLIATEAQPKEINLDFENEFLVGDVAFMKTNNNQVIVGGFINDTVEHKGCDLLSCGFFSFTINLSNNAVSTHSVKMFDDKFLVAIESNLKNGKKYQYKMDYIISSGNDVYFIGEQYEENKFIYPTHAGSSGLSGARVCWEYLYRDVIIGKMNESGEFEWLKNIPMRNILRLSYSHVFKEYCVMKTDNNIYIMRNSHPDNSKMINSSSYNPEDLKSVKAIHGSSFVYSSIGLIDGQVKHGIVFENDKYCFAPIQIMDPNFHLSSDCEIFVQGNNNEIYIYTEDRGKDRFDKIILE